ncbi:MAG TPA: phytanoyl-CoA dioxygenase family protein [Micromonospora sp.]
MTTRTLASPPVLTAADIAFYDEHGWWASPEPVLAADEITEAREAVERLHRDGVPADAPMAHKAHLNWRPGATTALRVNNYAAFLDPALRRLAVHPVVGALAAQLSGSPLIRLFNSSLVYKSGIGRTAGTADPADPADGTDRADPVEPASSVGWHTDKAYWSTCTSSRMLTAWIPLHDVTPDRSPLTVLDGSHRWPEEEVGDLRQIRGFTAAERGLMEQALRQRRVDVEPVAVTIPAGALSFHHCLTFHGSAPNASDQPRISLTVHLQDGANRWRPALDVDGSRLPYQHEDKVRRTADGRPDYTDPAFCPVLWPPGTPG